MERKAWSEGDASVRIRTPDDMTGSHGITDFEISPATDAVASPRQSERMIRVKSPWQSRRGKAQSMPNLREGGWNGF